METVEMFERHGRKIAALADMVDSASRILVVGCGDGREAGYLARRYQAETIGVGMDDGLFNHAAAAPATLVDMDARQLDFPDETFDLVYCFHALEHIPRPEEALAEIRRVLTPGGRYLMGTPNKSRLVGYVGAAEPIGNRIRFNVEDCKMRLRGQWSNDKGAHAGVTRRELTRICGENVGPARDVTDRYYDTLYAHRALALRGLRATRLQDWVYPAVYVAGSRR